MTYTPLEKSCLFQRHLPPEADIWRNSGGCEPLLNTDCADDTDAHGFHIRENPSVACHPRSFRPDEYSFIPQTTISITQPPPLSCWHTCGKEEEDGGAVF